MELSRALFKNVESDVFLLNLSQSATASDDIFGGPMAFIPYGFASVVNETFLTEFTL